MIRDLETVPSWLAVGISFLLFLGGWQAVVVIGEYDRFILPAPTDLWTQFTIV